MATAKSMTVILATILTTQTISARAAETVLYPGNPPGKAEVQADEKQILLRNNALSMSWPLQGENLGSGRFLDRLSGATLTNLGELFRITTRPRDFPASGLKCVESAKVEFLEPGINASRLADALTGKAVTMVFQEGDGLFRVTWRAILQDGAGYVRQEVAVTPIKADLELREVVLLEGVLPDAKIMGAVDGSPVVSGNFFFGCENPMAKTILSAGSDGGKVLQIVRCLLPRNSILRHGETLTLSSVLGVAPAGQMRRAFLHYLERERAHPFRPYLHYNSWYDTAWDPFALNETNCLHAIRVIGERFIQPHSVVFDGMVFDDGWDDPKSLWRFHSGFPRGFTPLAALCRDYNTRLGVWLSPFGGYGKPKDERMKFGSGQGYETNATGFSLAGPRYYQAFKDACVGMIRNYGVNHFKFDGIATGMYASGGGQFVLDTDAMRTLMLDLRREDPNLYINLTTGSWPSPFWLRYADSIWRQGGDMGHAGKGSRQQQWLTYRDQEVYRNIVLKGPLFPLNSLMTQGVAYSRHGMAGDPTFNSQGFKDDVRAFFGSGTGLQELYIQPDKLTTGDWRTLAEVAKWSRTNANVLVDTHWIGGDPSELQVYGYASWNGRKGIVMLRNPADQPHEFELDLATALELPAGPPASFLLSSPWAEDTAVPKLHAEVGKPVTFRLQPFEVIVRDVVPLK